MNLKVLVTTTVLLASFMANASCFKTYQEKLAETENDIENSNQRQARIEGAATVTTANVLVISALSGGAGGPMVSTTAGAGLIASLSLAKIYIDFRVEDDVNEALARKVLLEQSLRLLREAKAGYGQILLDTLMDVNRTVSNDISMKDIADKINQQSSNRVYCQNPDELMSPAGILKTAIDELKKEI